MPLEIRELVIKVTVDDRDNRSSVNEPDLQQLKEQLIKECTRKILDKIKTQSER